MAGNYPDAPSWRMALDRDGSVFFTIDKNGTLAERTAADAVAFNDEGATEVTIPGTTSSQSVWVGVVFPEVRDVDGIHLNISVPGAPDPTKATATLQVSETTTNGQDGEWVDVTGLGTFDDLELQAAVPAYRTNINTGTVLSVRGVRFRLWSFMFSGSTILRSFHVYGEAAPGATGVRLELWHPTNDEKLPPAWLDWGDVPRGSSDDRAFRVKNVSTTSTAEDVRVALDGLSDASPSIVGQHLLSFGGGAFLSQVNVGDLAPGAISGAVTVRRVLATNAQLGLFTFRVFAEADGWS